MIQRLGKPIGVILLPHRCRECWVELGILTSGEVKNGLWVVRQPVTRSDIDSGNRLSLRAQPLQHFWSPVDLNRSEAIGAVKVCQLVELTGIIPVRIVPAGNR